MKSLFLRVILLLAVYECNTQFMRYNGHYYAFYRLQANLSFAILTCLGKARSNVTEDITTISGRSYPVVLNDQEEQAEILRFYRENSRVQNSFVWIGGRARETDDEFDECEQRRGKPTGYNCSDPRLMSLADASYSNHTAWDPSIDGADISGGDAAVWSKQSNTWLLASGENDDPRVKELICEYASHCVSPHIRCTAGAVCLRRTAYTTYTCVCHEGFTGPDCIDAVTEAPSASSSNRGISNNALYGIIAAASVLFLSGATIVYSRIRNSRYSAPPGGVGYHPSASSAVSGASAVDPDGY